MVTNALLILIGWVRRYASGPDVPVVFVQDFLGSKYQVVVMKIPSEERAVA